MPCISHASVRVSTKACVKTFISVSGVSYSGGLFCWKTEAINLTQEFGSIRASKFVSQNSPLNSGSAGAKSPMQTFQKFCLPRFPRFRVCIFRFFAWWSLLKPLFLQGKRGPSVFSAFSRIGFELLISKIRPTGFIVTGLRWQGILTEAQPGRFPNRGVPHFFGKGPDSVADPFRECSL